MSDQLSLDPAAVPEWDDEDEAFADLGDEFETANSDQARAMFNKVTFELPRPTVCQELLSFAAARPSPLGLEITDDQRERFNFYLHEVPLTVFLSPPLGNVQRARDSFN